jgi:hypothetical protein
MQYLLFTLRRGELCDFPFAVKETLADMGFDTARVALTNRRNTVEVLIYDFCVQCRAQELQDLLRIRGFETEWKLVEF